MKALNPAVSSCRHCQFYHSEGRRGGSCQQLGVPVQASWHSCSLAISPFTSWKKLAEIATWKAAEANPEVLPEVLNASVLPSPLSLAE